MSPGLPQPRPAGFPCWWPEAQGSVPRLGAALSSPRDAAGALEPLQRGLALLTAVSCRFCPLSARVDCPRCPPLQVIMRRPCHSRGASCPRSHRGASSGPGLRPPEPLPSLYRQQAEGSPAPLPGPAHGRLSWAWVCWLCYLVMVTIYCALTVYQLLSATWCTGAGSGRPRAINPKRLTPQVGRRAHQGLRQPETASVLGPRAGHRLCGFSVPCHRAPGRGLRDRGSEPPSLRQPGVNASEIHPVKGKGRRRTAGCLTSAPVQATSQGDTGRGDALPRPWEFPRQWLGLVL